MARKMVKFNNIPKPLQTNNLSKPAVNLTS